MKRIYLLFITLITFGGIVNAQSAFQQLQKVLAGDAQAGDNFGYSVAINGDYAVVGARYESAGGSQAGAAYFFERDSETGTWSQVNKVTASDAAAFDRFGNSVSISENYAIIAAYTEDEGATDAGAVYFFERDNSSGTWTEVSKLLASDAQANDEFGWSVSISGNFAVVGARMEDAGGTDAGAAYFFELSGGTWSQVNKVTASDAQAGDLFGVSVSMSGNYTLIGAMQEDAGGTDAGAAYLFELSGGTWSQVDKVTASDAQAGDYFGYSVSLSGNNAVIGAFLEDAEGTNAGAAYFFDLNSNSLSEVNKVTASDAQAGDEFGISVSVSGNYALIGARYEDTRGSDAGAAYFFELRNGTWIELNKVTASDGQAEDWFGWPLQISGFNAIIGALYEDEGGSAAGAAYFFYATFPQNHTSTFTLNQNDLNQIDFNIESLASIEADGYIILYKQGSSFSSVPANGGNYSVGTTIGDATVGAIITDEDAVEATVANLTKQTEYHFKIYPFNWDGSDITTATYKTAGNVPSLTVVTVPTLGEWGMIAFVGFMAIGGFVYMRRRIV